MSTRLLVEKALRVFGEIVHEIEGGNDLHRDCFGYWFAGFARDQSRDLFELIEHDFASTKNELRALAIRKCSPMTAVRPSLC